MRILLVSLVALLATTSPSASPDCAADACYTQQEAHADLDALFEQMRAEHVDMFARTDEAAYREHLAELKRRIDGPVPKPELHLMLQELAAFGRIGHARTDIAVQGTVARLQEGAKILPLSVQYRGERMILDAWATDGDTLPPGSELTSLGGLTRPDFEQRVATFVAADTPQLLRAQIEQGMPIYARLVFGDRASLPVDFVTPDGSAGTLEVPATDYAGYLALQEGRPVPSSGRDPSARRYEVLGDHVFYLQPGPFFATEAEREAAGGEAYALDGFDAFVRDAMGALGDSGAEALLIDLRGNPGGDVSFSDLIVSRIADRPYRFASHYEVKAGANTLATYADREPAGDTLFDRVLARLPEAEVGSTFEVPVPEVTPMPDLSFDGKVYVLIDRHSYSNAAVVAATIQDYGFGTLIGEETADLPTTYGAVESFTLPHSGAVVHYPKAYMIRPDGSTAVAGVAPDWPIAPGPVGQEGDAMLEAAVERIRDASTLRQIKTTVWPTFYREQDIDGLSAFLAPDFVNIAPDGTVTPRAQELESVAETAWNPANFRYEVQRIAWVDADTVLVVGEGTSDRTDDGGEPCRHRYTSSNLLKRAPDSELGWQAHASHVSGVRCEDG